MGRPKKNRQQGADAAPNTARATKGQPLGPRRKAQNDGAVSIAEAASLLGMGRSGVRSLMQRGKLTGEKRDGVHYFDRATIVRMALDRGVEVVKPTARGDQASQVFTQLRVGTSPVELVIRFRMTPEEIRKLVAEYNELRELEVTHAKSRQCQKCGEAVARFCGGCATTAESPAARAG